MKKCPYCAEEIQDEAILCRYCHSDLTVAPPSSASSPTPTSPAPASSGPTASTEAEAPPPSQEQPTGSGLGDTFAFGPGGSSTAGPGAGGDRGSETTTTAADEVEPSDATKRSPDIAETPGASAVMDAEAATSTRTGAERSDTDDVAMTSPVQTAPASAPSPAAWSTTGAESTGVAAAGPGSGAAAGAAAATPAPDSATAGAVESGPVTYTHSGHRYVLGYGADFFGIWDRQAPAAPVERFPRTDDGWRQAWQRYVGLEPSNVEVAAGAPGPGAPGPSPSAGAPALGVATPAGAGPAMQYTHSGQRYLLGYGADFFGIWDRQSLAQPVQRFPRTDDGWKAAWQQYASWEPHSTEVGIGGGS